MRTALVIAAITLVVFASAQDSKNEKTKADDIPGQGGLSELDHQRMFSSWMTQHNKSYKRSELFSRYNIFKANNLIIALHNAGTCEIVFAIDCPVELTPCVQATFRTLCR